MNNKLDNSKDLREIKNVQYSNKKKLDYNEKIKEYDMFPNKNGYAIIISNTSHLDRAIEFLEYLDTP